MFFLYRVCLKNTRLLKLAESFFFTLLSDTLQKNLIFIKLKRQKAGQKFCMNSCEPTYRLSFNHCKL